MGKRITAALEQVMESRRIYQLTAGGQPVPVSDSAGQFMAHVAAPILAEGDLLGMVLFIGTDPAQIPGDAEYKLAQTVAAVLGKHMEAYLQKNGFAIFLRRLQSAAAHSLRSHVCALRSVFVDVHAAANTKSHPFRVCGRETLRGLRAADGRPTYL